MNANAHPECFRFAQKLREKMTPEERILWGYLYNRPLGKKFRRQHPFGPYILDFFCLSAKLSIEIDGSNHLRTKQKLHDNERSLFIESYGIKELRFTNGRILNDCKEVIKDIVRFL